MENLRKNVVAGQFYPGDRKELLRVVNSYLVNKIEKDVIGVVSPHAGYPFSGKLMGEVLSLLPFKKTYILLGVNHSGIGKNISFSERDFKTPLGIVKNDLGLAHNIKEKLREGLNIGFSDSAHKREHSLEVLLPFLQAKFREENFKIVPILLRDLGYEDCMKFAEALSVFLKDDVGLIVSSDFTHFGHSFGFVPFKENVKENLYGIDNEIIEGINQKDPKKVFDLGIKSTVCGFLGLTVISKLAKIMGWDVRKIDYYTSGEVTGDWNHVVGYGGLVFENKKKGK